MKIKLDESIGRRGVELLTVAGHDVMTVRDQSLRGASDETLFDVCANEDRVLITLDHDFGQVLRFPPERGAGLIIEPTTAWGKDALTVPLKTNLVIGAIQVLNKEESAGTDGGSSWVRSVDR